MTERTDIATPSSPRPEALESKEPPPVRTRKRQAFSTAVAIIARARDELQHLTGYKVDSVSAFERTDDGWRLSVTVVELRRIPSATDVLASYEVILDETGDIVTYHRGSRYFRDQVGQDQ
ncbi:Gas vesicle synthesis protein GvpO [Enhydrobacter aerosaccus]|uniref:Gas vesicle synthesis protein GvpO n=1 Tax=Enhydrobacter aerosaccus TaxID=225324 RepID=A0A1T4LW45_9HYPH|nr:gas vesicle protein [Enhydrobacter aerosaccus]SJZ58674.1 Gas vesicle synthesis protein GvpO [Enhydrobacter aerosaccus]